MDPVIPIIIIVIAATLVVYLTLFSGGSVTSKPPTDAKESFIDVSKVESERAREQVCTIAGAQFDNACEGDARVRRTLFFGPRKHHNDPYFMRKIRYGPDNHELRLTINDNSDETMQIWGDSCSSPGGCGGPGRRQHVFRADGSASHRKGVVISSGEDSAHLGGHPGLHVRNHKTGGWTHFPWTDGKNYIRGDTRVDGELTAPGYVKTNSIGAVGMSQGHNGNDWLRVWGGHNGTAIHHNTAINGNGGLVVGDWARVPTGEIHAKNKFCIGGECITRDHIRMLTGKNATIIKSSTTGKNLVVNPAEGSGTGRFGNANRGPWERVYITKCLPGQGGWCARRTNTEEAEWKPPPPPTAVQQAMSGSMFRLMDGWGRYWSVQGNELRLTTNAGAASVFRLAVVNGMYKMRNNARGFAILQNGDKGRAIRHSGWVMWAHDFGRWGPLYDFSWSLDVRSGSTVLIRNDYENTLVGVSDRDHNRVSILRQGHGLIREWKIVIGGAVASPARAPARPQVPAFRPSRVEDTSEDGMPKSWFGRNFGFAVYPQKNVFAVGGCYHIKDVAGIRSNATYIRVLGIHRRRHHNKDVITYMPVHPSVHPLLKSYRSINVGQNSPSCFGTRR
jgi:hypothetical protein